MLVLTRKTDERIQIGDEVELVVLSIRGNRVRLGIVAPENVLIARPETPRNLPADRESEELLCRR